MLVSAIMRTPVTTITAGMSVRAAAALMGELGVGLLPVCKGGCPIGVLTDRDIVTRWVPNAVADESVESVMTDHVVTCFNDQPIQEAAYLMANTQIRRLVVLSRAGDIVGIVTVGDIANDASEELAGQTLGEIVEKR